MPLFAARLHALDNPPRRVILVPPRRNENYGVRVLAPAQEIVKIPIPNTVTLQARIGRRPALQKIVANSKVEAPARDRAIDAGANILAARRKLPVIGAARIVRHLRLRENLKMAIVAGKIA